MGTKVWRVPMRGLSLGLNKWCCCWLAAMERRCSPPCSCRCVVQCLQGARLISPLILWHRPNLVTTRPFGACKCRRAAGLDSVCGVKWWWLLPTAVMMALAVAADSTLSEEQLLQLQQQLQDMGFATTDTNKELLIKYNGNLERVANKLL